MPFVPARLRHSGTKKQNGLCKEVYLDEQKRHDGDNFNIIFNRFRSKHWVWCFFSGLQKSWQIQRTKSLLGEGGFFVDEKFISNKGEGFGGIIGIEEIK